MLSKFATRAIKATTVRVIFGELVIMKEFSVKSMNYDTNDEAPESKFDDHFHERNLTSFWQFASEQHR